MFSINELKCILKPYFKIDNRRLDCLAQILVALITVRTVNLVELAQAMITGGVFEARYKRLRRFFKEFKGFSFVILSKFIAQFIAIFGYDVIGELLGDREFVSAKWFKWLQEEEIFFTIRLKKSIAVLSAKENKTYVRQLFINLRPGQVRYIKKHKEIFGISLWLAATRADDGEWVIVATNHEPESALARYKLRWNIETLFGFLKSKGFYFEDTHITFPERLHNLLSVLTIVFCLAYKVGEIVAKEVPIKKKKHGRLEKSILRGWTRFIKRNIF